MGKRKIILISGGARSGKSKMALELAGNGPRTFIATADAADEEMKYRIEIHRKERSKDWTTIEEPLNVPEVLNKIPTNPAVIDCLTLWLSNLLMRGMNDAEICSQFESLTEILRSRTELTVLVTNEVGLGIVPENPLARRFRDLSGIMNQRFAVCADMVIFMIASLPLYVKGKQKYENS
jgi:adenosylcobinamide kinase / adenosylcobinamide-phosphate guanylyltransferase